ISLVRVVKGTCKDMRFDSETRVFRLVCVAP
ncbi:uncharacterized protein METZ01_LOCUS130824, partial [marine metagenome]